MCACNCATCTLNNSSTTKDALFYATSGKAVATYKLQPCTKLLSCYFCAIKNDNKNLGAYNCSTHLHVTTTLLNECIFVHVQVHSKIRLMNSHLSESSTIVVSLQTTQEVYVLPYFITGYRIHVYPNIVYHTVCRLILKFLHTSNFHDIRK